MSKGKAFASQEIDLTKPSEKIGAADSWLSQDSDLRVIIKGSTLVVGDPEEVLKFVGSGEFQRSTLFSLFAATTAASVSFFNDTATVTRVANVLSESKPTDPVIAAFSLTETRFNQKGIERRVVSDLGMIGTMISQFAPE
jgi:hypothetical protein